MKHPGVVVDDSKEWQLGDEFERELLDSVEKYVSDIVSQIVHSLKLRLYWNDSDDREPLGLQFCLWADGNPEEWADMGPLAETNVVFSVDHVVELAKDFYSGEPEHLAKMAAQLRIMADRIEAIK